MCIMSEEYMEDPEIKVNPVIVAKIQSFMNDPIYRETIESAASFNARLSADRTSRLPFLDSQTGVAQNHSSLWMDARERLPGLREGQIYTYPSKRWKKKRRQYLLNFMQPRYPHGMIRKETPDECEPPVISEAPNGNIVPGLAVDEPKDIVPKDDVKPPEAWYYDDLDLPDTGEFDEPDADSDYDYEESFSKRKKKKPVAPKVTRQTNTRGRRKITYDAVTDPEKPFSCDICGARYKTRPGLTYHYSHSHKDKEDEDEEEMKRDEGSAARRHSNNQRSSTGSIQPPILHPQQQHPLQQLQPPTLHPQQGPPHHQMGGMGMGMGIPPPHPGMMPPHHMPHPHQLHPPPPHLIPQQPPPHLMHQNIPPGSSPPHPSVMTIASSPPSAPVAGPSTRQEPATNQEDSGKKLGEASSNQKPRVQPSLYCDFCLGDAMENKKSGSPEELVSCSDCGRSGHPSCLQFTVNMIISVKKYRWQCIECKCCSICGNSDNDDQLLFCDDCDRGYHMYCLTPPLDAPPEGSWSCSLCIAEFHQSK